MTAVVQVSRTPRARFGYRGALPGVGEALRREIAGLVLVRWLLWGFERRVRVVPELTSRFNWPLLNCYGIGFAPILLISAVFYYFRRFLRRRGLNRGMRIVAQTICRAAGGVVCDVRRVYHAAVLFV